MHIDASKVVSLTQSASKGRVSCSFHRSVSMATAVAPSTTPLPTSPLYQVLVYPHHHNQSATPSDSLLSASPAGALLQLTKQHHYMQSINQLQLNASTDTSTLPPHTGPTAINRPTFPLALTSLASDLDSPLVLQNTAVSLSQLTAEQKYPGKERDTPPAQWDEDKARVDEREGRDGPHMDWCKQLFLTHTAANVIRDQLKDGSALGWTADDDAHYDSAAKTRETVLEALTAEQEDEMAELDSLSFPASPNITLPTTTPLPTLPTPEGALAALSQRPPTDTALLTPVRPVIPTRFFVPAAPADPMPPTPRQLSTDGASSADENATLFSAALELSQLSASVPDLPDLPDYSDIALPEMPDIPDVPEPPAEDAGGVSAGESSTRTGSISSARSSVSTASTASSQSSSSATPPYLNAMPANLVYTPPVAAGGDVGGRAGGPMAGSSLSSMSSPPPRPARPQRPGQGGRLPSAQGVNVNAGVGGGRMSMGGVGGSGGSGQNAALNAALRTTLHEISDEQLQEVLANK